MSAAKESDTSTSERPCCSFLASPSATRDVLARHGLSTKKSLGQHFLIDDHVVARTLGMAELAEDETVLEVGPGIGTLTVALLRRCRAVVSIERDRDLLPVLSETCAQDSEKLGLIAGDALAMQPDDIAGACDRLGVAMPRKLVANLPYAVAATILLDFFERFECLERAVVMVQSEVADRISAVPGTKDYGAYTVKLALHAQVVGRFEVSPSCFFPPPRVNSTVIELVRQAPSFEGAPASSELIDAAALAADAAFAQRRKTIRNSMSAHLGPRGLSREDVGRVLEEAHIAPTLRGETLGIGEFLELGQALVGCGI